ncbi:unnamed protein product [Closterium sp. Yama58-4]|nr:unnamed protein product [Closterium sp. Yama58-4]
MSAMSDNVGQYGRIGTVPVAQGAEVPLTHPEFPYTPEPAASRGSDTFSSTAGGAGSSLPPPPVGIWGVFTVAFYRPFFDVDTADVAERVRDALMPFPRSAFLEKTALNPDIYGPFWICTTLVFLSASLGNLASYLSYAASPSSAAEEHWHYNIDAVSWAAAIFYGYVAVVPLLLFFLLRYLQVSAGLVQLWCLYGYSLAVYIPISFITVLPLDLLRWLIVLAATAISCFFLGVNLRAQITVGHEMWFPIVVGAVLLQAGLGVLLKLYFFTYIQL